MRLFWQKKMDYRYGKNVLITGVSSGLGKACAQMFAQNGYHVWGVSRSCGNTVTQCGKGMIHTKSMDVTQDNDVHSVVGEIMEEAGQINILIHCAGMGISGAAEEVPIELAARQMDTNYFGVLRVNAAVLPHMREQGNGIVLVMSSVAGVISIPFQSHYSSSKFALEAYIEALRMECRPFGIQAALIEPGDTKTGFTASREKYSCADSAYDTVCKRAVEKMENDEQNGKPASSAAKTAFVLCAKKHLPIRRAVGWEYRALLFLKKILPARLVEFLVQKIYLS
jgi:short-subunit dehydrogenase